MGREVFKVEYEGEKRRRREKSKGKKEKKKKRRRKKKKKKKKKRKRIYQCDPPYAAEGSSQLFTGRNITLLLSSFRKLKSRP